MTASSLSERTDPDATDVPLSEYSGDRKSAFSIAGNTVVVRSLEVTQVPMKS